MRGEGMRELVAKRVRPAGVQLWHRDAVRWASLVEGQQAASVPDQGGVGPVALLGRSLEGVVERLAGGVLLLPACGADITVTITSLTALHPHPVQHAVAEKPVVIAERRKLRVGPVAHKHA